MNNYYLNEYTTSIDEYSKSLELILPKASVKSKERSNDFFAFGDGIISNDFYLGTSFTHGLVEIEVENSNSVVVTIPIKGEYQSRFSNTVQKIHTPESGSVFMPTDSIKYSTKIDDIEDLMLILNYNDLVPLLEHNYGIFNTLDNCFRFDRGNPKTQLHYELMMNNLQVLRLYPHIRESYHFKSSIKEVAKLLMTELIADSLNIPFKLNNTPDSCIVKHAEELIDASPETYFHVKEIADKLNTSTRNLQLAFSKHRNYTPMHFLKERKLFKARQLLLNSNNNTLIKRIALDSGFLNLSNFSKNYKEQFGELPSETLKND